MVKKVFITAFFAIFVCLFGCKIVGEEIKFPEPYEVIVVTKSATTTVYFAKTSEKLRQLTGKTLFPERIEVSIANQTLRIVESNRKVFGCFVSTGKFVGSTPKGNFWIFNGGRNAISKKYQVPLINYWNFTRDPKEGATIAIHALSGTSYERNLGHRASHGCVRVSHKDSAVIYSWVVQTRQRNGYYPQVTIR
jgi:lipoprotein-anchoring transpeptidase ErfK/SrfK